MSSNQTLLLTQPAAGYTAALHSSASITPLKRILFETSGETMEHSEKSGIPEFHMDSGALAWKATPVPGVTIRLLREDSTTHERTLLLRMDPGASFPFHLHPQGEQTFVLKGSVQIGSIHATAGGYVYAPPGNRHSVQTTDGCELFITVPAPITIL